MESSTANFNQDRNSVIEIFFAVGSMGGILSKSFFEKLHKIQR